MKRWAAMSKAFTRIGKDIVMAVKEGGPDPDANAKLRAVIQNAKAVNMPKDNIERAIKRASDKNQGDYKEVLFEGYAPHGIAVLIETATDNNTRTVANIRSYFNKCNGSLGTSGSVEFMFDHTCSFTINGEGLDPEELELELIDFGAEEVFVENPVSVDGCATSIFCQTIDWGGEGCNGCREEDPDRHCQCVGNTDHDQPFGWFDALLQNNPYHWICVLLRLLFAPSLCTFSLRLVILRCVLCIRVS